MELGNTRILYSGVVCAIINATLVGILGLKAVLDAQILIIGIKWVIHVLANQDIMKQGQLSVHHVIINVPHAMHLVQTPALHATIAGIEVYPVPGVSAMMATMKMETAFALLAIILAAHVQTMADAPRVRHHIKEYLTTSITIAHA